MQYSQQRIKKYGAPYILFGTFVAINFTYPYFMWNSPTSQHYSLILSLRLLGALLCGMLIAKSKWPQGLLPYFPLYWHLVILYCLPFIGTIMLLLTQSNIEWVVNIAITVILLLIVVDWLTALIIGGLGILLALGFYRLFIGEINLSLDFTSKYLLIYQGIFGLLIGLIFARRKQLAYNQVATQRDYLKEVQQHTSHERVETLKFRDALLSELEGFQAQAIPLLDEASSNYLKQVLYRFTDYLRLDVTQVDLNHFFGKVMDIPQMQGLSLPTALQIQKHTQVTDIQADENKLYEVFVNSITYLANHNTEQNPIRIILADSQLGHAVAHMEGHIRRLNALKITITTSETIPTASEQDIYMLNGSTSNRSLIQIGYYK